MNTKSNADQTFELIKGTHILILIMSCSVSLIFIWNEMTTKDRERTVWHMMYISL